MQPVNRIIHHCPKCGALILTSSTTDLQHVRCTSCGEEVNLEELPVPTPGAPPPYPAKPEPETTTQDETERTRQAAMEWLAGLGLEVEDTETEAIRDEDEQDENESEASRPPLPAWTRGLERPKPTTPYNGNGCSLIFAIVWTSFSFLFVVVGIGFYRNQRQEYNLLRQEGLLATGTITELVIDDDGDSTSYDVYYRFTAQVGGTGRVLDQWQSVSKKEFESFRVGEQVQIIYAPSDPTISRLQAVFGPPDLVLPLCFGGMGSLFTLIGVALFLGSLRGLTTHGGLVLRGKITEAVVFDKWTEEDADGDAVKIIGYAFRATKIDGLLTTIAHAEINPKAYHQLAIGDQALVRYQQDKPDICRLENIR